jgi:hypothetical protein
VLDPTVGNILSLPRRGSNSPFSTKLTNTASAE